MPVARIEGPSNKGMHQTGREGAAIRSSGPVVEARPAGDARGGLKGTTQHIGQDLVLDTGEPRWSESGLEMRDV